MKEPAVFKEEKGASSRMDVAPPARPVELRIGYLGGGSRAWAIALMKDLARTPYLKGEVRLYDIDPAAAAFNARYGNWLQGHPTNVARWRYRAVRTMREALAGCDFVFLSIQPGPLLFMKHDLEIPQRYGIWQPVGDTVGPGGVVRGFRSARIYKGFAEAIARHAPKAWALNFTNPMTVCTRSLHAAFPGIKAYGCCHEVFTTQKMLGRLLAKERGIEPPSREEVMVNVLGINHFTWIDRAWWKGVDLLAVLRRHLDRHPSAMKFYTEREVMRRCKTVFGCMERVTFELFDRFGVLPAAGDRHLAEFVPWFLTGEKSCFKWGFRLTPFSHRSGRWKNAPRLFRRQMAGEVPVEFRDSGEEYIHQMAAILGILPAFRTNVNLPNKGQMLGVPHGPVVETNAIFSRNSVEPVASGGLPPEVHALVLPHVASQEAIVRAAFEGDEELGFRAFITDRLTSRLPLDQAHKMFRQMLAATRFKF
jgi:alpha-galactosidase